MLLLMQNQELPGSGNWRDIVAQDHFGAGGSATESWAPIEVSGLRRLRLVRTAMTALWAARH